MYLIVGLGNPGIEYKKTRHNVGFMFIDKLAGKENFSFDKKREIEVLTMKNVVLAKPQTFMNDSGRAIRKLIDYYKWSVENLVVIHDDLDIAFGEYKIQREKGPKIHNGIKSVERTLGRNDFWRVRIGIDNRQPNVSYGTGADYVLSNMSKDELNELNNVIEESLKELTEILGIDIK